MQEKEISLARYAAVSFIQQLLSEGKSLNYALCLAAQRCWGLRCYSASTLEKWYYRYRLEGFEALKPKRRKDKGVRKCLSSDQKEALGQLREKHPQLTVKSLLRRLKAQGVLNPGKILPPA